MDAIQLKLVIVISLAAKKVQRRIYQLKATTHQLAQNNLCDTYTHMSASSIVSPPPTTTPL